MNTPLEHDEFSAAATSRFRDLVESVGVKRFAASMGLSTRQVNRMRSGAQPNPVERIIRSLQASQTEIGDSVLSFICQEAGGHFVKEPGTITDASVNAVKECAEAIAAISDGKLSKPDEEEVREAISALAGLLRAVQYGEPIEPASSSVVVRSKRSAAEARIAGG